MQKIRLLIIVLTLHIICPTFAEDSNQYCYVTHDPLEKMNRGIFAFNNVLDDFILAPVVLVYRHTVPEWGRSRAHDFFGNIKSPITLINNILQGDGKSASVTVGRMLVNFFMGFGGLVDFASQFDDMDENPQGFSDTLASYGVPYGSYVVIPFLGPSTSRGSVGRLVDAFSDPIDYIIPTYLDRLYYTAASNFESRIWYDDLIKSTQESSVDYYTRTRSMYIQYISKRNIHCPAQPPIDYSSDGSEDSTSDSPQKDKENNNKKSEEDNEVQ